MKDRLFSIMGFGKRSETLAARLEKEGISYGWGAETHLLLLLVDSNDTDSFILRLCHKAKEKGTRIVFISLNPALNTKPFGFVADGILLNDSERDVSAIIKSLHHIIYRHNILSYGINDVIKFLQTSGTGCIAIQQHGFDGLDISQVGNICFPQAKNTPVRHLTAIHLCQPFGLELLEGVKTVFADVDGMTLNCIVEEDGLKKSELTVISVSD